MKNTSVFKIMSFFGKTRRYSIICFSCLLVLFISPTLAFSQKPNSNIYTYQVIPAVENTWGYNISKSKKLFIHQPFAPGLSGNRGFSTKEKASIAAKIVINKINKGIMPPSLSKAEVHKIENEL